MVMFQFERNPLGAPHQCCLATTSFSWYTFKRSYSYSYSIKHPIFLKLESKLLGPSTVAMATEILLEMVALKRVKMIWRVSVYCCVLLLKSLSLIGNGHIN